MKELPILVIFLTTSIGLTYGQEFSTLLYFENELGQRDTVIVGYDPLASEDIDSAFMEVNIKGERRDSLDIRLVKIEQTCPLPEPFNYDEEILFETKKNIVPKSCNSFLDPYGSSVLQCLIPNAALPLDIRWDAMVFQNDCLRESLITELPDEGWWDIFCNDLFWGVVSLSGNNGARIEEPVGHQIINDQNDTFSLLFIGMLHKDIGSNIDEAIDNPLPILLPNPVSDVLQIDIGNIQNFSGQFILRNALGQIQKQIDIHSGQRRYQLPVYDLQPGMYFYEISSAGQSVKSGRVVVK